MTDHVGVSRKAQRVKRKVSSKRDCCQMNISSTEREQQKVAWLQSLHDGPEEQNCVGVNAAEHDGVIAFNTEHLSDRTRRVGVSSHELKRPES